MTNRTDPFPVGSFSYDPFDRTLVIEERELANLMCELCRHGEIQPVRRLLDAGADVNALDSDGYFPLYWAAAEGNLTVLRLLLESGASIGQASRPEEFTALHAAACHGRLSIVQALIDARAEVNRLSRSGSTPAMMAAGGAHVDVIRALIAAGADLNIQDRIQANTLLIHACATGKCEIVKLALEAKVNTAQRMKNGLNALDIACHNGQLDAVRILLAHDADVHNPLEFASVGGHIEICRLLLDNGFDIETETDDGISPLAAAADMGRPDIIELLISAGAEAQFDREALIRASASGHTVIVQKLLRAGANPDMKALMRASEEGHIEIVRVLLDAGADPVKKTKQGHSALGRAAARGLNDIVEILAQGSNGALGDNRCLSHRSYMNLDGTTHGRGKSSCRNC